jgi:hypothetical protein
VEKSQEGCPSQERDAIPHDSKVWSPLDWQARPHEDDEGEDEKIEKNRLQKVSPLHHDPHRLPLVDPRGGLIGDSAANVISTSPWKGAAEAMVGLEDGEEQVPLQEQDELIIVAHELILLEMELGIGMVGMVEPIDGFLFEECSSFLYSHETSCIVTRGTQPGKEPRQRPQAATDGSLQHE